ncbi:integral membrane protein [Anaeramoeba ignava]|uniref:Integral membrane protein n=1 Tax=Anaeramoeba ignava TaxID=1746090 RepID=A0A9Q0LA06_ANAIG|nr:integral membrane protein [Anaeramoeba ignava]
MHLNDVINQVAPSAIRLKCVSLGFLSVFYLLIAIFTFYVLYLNLRSFFQFSRLKIKYRTALLILIFIFMFLRFVLLFFPIQWKYLFDLLFICYVIPLFLQFSTFFMLVIFLLVMIFAAKEKKKAQLIALIIYICVDVVIFVLLILGVVYQMSLSIEEFDNRTSTYVAISYIILIIVFISFRIKISRQFFIKSFPEGIKRSIIKFMTLITIYSVIYFIRSIFGLVSVLANKSSFYEFLHLGDSSNKEAYYGLYGIFMFMFEILPAIVLVFSFYGSLHSEKKAFDQNQNSVDKIDQYNNISSPESNEDNSESNENTYLN